MIPIYDVQDRFINIVKAYPLLYMGDETPIYMAKTKAKVRFNSGKERIMELGHSHCMTTDITEECHAILKGHLVSTIQSFCLKEKARIVEYLEPTR
jgi:hypothetical protein